MNCDQVWTGIIIPIIAAVIGGGITMWGVILTIKREKQKDDENRILAAKPWIFSYENTKVFNSTDANKIHLSADGTLSDKNAMLREILIKNTDNGIGIVEKLETENNTYYPVVGRVLEKNTTSVLFIHWYDKENYKMMRLYIRDVYKNQYCYEVYQSNPKVKSAWLIREMEK